MRALLDLLGHGASPEVWASVLADSAIKGAGVLLLAGAITAGLRYGPAAARHLVWTLALLGISVLPAVSASLPGWHLPVLPQTSSASRATIGQAGPAGGDLFQVQVAPAQVMSGAGGSAVAIAEGVKRERSIAPNGWGTWILLVWGGGAVMVLAQLVVSLVGVWHKGRRPVAVAEGEWIALAAEVAERYGIRRRVTLRLTAEGMIPATCGFWRPVVFFPVDALDWPRERIRAVLLHELAHVARGDFLVQTLARAACALHWFNPLAWRAARRLRRESEQASDDLAVGAGLTPSGYASQLIDVLMAARREHFTRGALAMARRGELEERVRAILDDRRSHRLLSPRGVALATLAAACCLLSLGLVRLEAKAQDAPKLDRPLGGMTIEVVGISTHPSGPATWWGPDGTPLETAPCDPVAQMSDGADKQVREIVTRITGLPAGAALTWHPGNCVSRGAPVRKDDQPVPGLERCIAEFSQKADVCSLHFYISLGEWETEYACDAEGRGIETSNRVFFFGSARETRRGTARVVAHNIMDRDVRLVAVDHSGREHYPGAATSGAKQMRMIDVEFALPPDQIAEYRLKSRPIVRFEIDNVALQPRKAEK
jgi:beta-lactamase regulating signal transducer with metallopeptidase domain